MKLLLLVLFPLYLLAQPRFNGVLPLNDKNEAQYQVVKAVDGAAKADMFKRARKWFVANYNSAKNVLQVNDSETGELTGHGNFVVRFKRGFEYESLIIQHTVSVDLKDNKYRITLNDLFVESTSSGVFKRPLDNVSMMTGKKYYALLYPAVDEKCRDLITSLEKALSTPDDF